LPLRTLKKVELIELGPVAVPAYTQTTVSLSDARSPEAVERLRAAKALIAAAKRQRSGARC
jgi:phage head maturation protease